MAQRVNSKQLGLPRLTMARIAWVFVEGADGIGVSCSSTCPGAHPSHSAVFDGCACHRCYCAGFQRGVLLNAPHVDIRGYQYTISFIRILSDLLPLVSMLSSARVWLVACHLIK